MKNYKCTKEDHLISVPNCRWDSEPNNWGYIWICGWR